jgi:D-serine deaminase-like pyridoxal phosphate-dependent protein
LAKLVFNSGGSTTYPLYEKIGLINEIATASALVKPTDFDVFTLDHHVPAAFIAAPVLKVIKDPELPMAKSLSKLMHRVGLLPRKACFIYGGNWLAQPCYPADSKRANILGHSSNQEMYELKASDQINVDDFMYFRPTQSEAVFLQFGEVAVYDDGKIVDWWPVFESKRSE